MNVNFQRWFYKMLKCFSKHLFVGYWHHLQLTQAHSTSERQKLTATIFGLYSCSFKLYFFYSINIMWMAWQIWSAELLQY